MYHNGGILNIENKNIFQFSIVDLEAKELNGVGLNFNNYFYLDDEMNIELDLHSVKWIFILDPLSEFGLFFFMFDLKITSDNALEALSKCKMFRYLKEPSNNVNKIKVVDENNNLSEKSSFFSIFETYFSDVSNEIQFLEPKPIQFHYLDKSAFYNEKDRDSHCYNLLRMPAKPNNEVEKRYFEKNHNHVYENSSIFAFSMTEGLILTSAYKTPKMLVSNFFASQIITLFHKRFVHILSKGMGAAYVSDVKLSNKLIESLKNMRSEINISNYYLSMPISQYSEIQEIYNLSKTNLFSETNQNTVKEALNEVTTLIMSQAEFENNERDRKFGLILGVLGITGFISFIFDYLVISKNQKLIDALEFPFNILPIFLFFIIFVLIWKFLNKGK